MVSHLPAGSAEVAFRQQAGLDPRGQQQILLQRALLRGLEAIQAELGQRIGKQPLRLNCPGAMLADAIASVVNAFQRVVHLLQQLQQVGGLCLGDRGFQFLPPDHQLVAQQVQIGRLNAHDETPSVTESFLRCDDSDFLLFLFASARSKAERAKWTAYSCRGPLRYPTFAVKATIALVTAYYIGYSAFIGHHAGRDRTLEHSWRRRL